MSDEAGVIEHEPTALAVRESAALPVPTFGAEQMAAAIVSYRELQHALDKSMPDQIMDLDGKAFRKKGYWRALAVAFNLTVEPVEEKREIDGQFADGRDNFGYVVTYRASARGRSVTGDGSCFAVEKAPRFRCPHPEREGSTRTLHFPGERCPDFDASFAWHALPRQASVHNIRSHAHTRAYNRAVSNLVGFGEVSAEEVDRDEIQPSRAVEGEVMPPRQEGRRVDGTPVGPGVNIYAGDCTFCNGDVPKGEGYRDKRPNGKWGAIHVECFKSREVEQATAGGAR